MSSSSVDMQKADILQIIGECEIYTNYLAEQARLNAERQERARAHLVWLEGNSTHEGATTMSIKENLLEIQRLVNKSLDFIATVEGATVQGNTTPEPAKPEPSKPAEPVSINAAYLEIDRLVTAGAFGPPLTSKKFIPQDMQRKLGVYNGGEIDPEEREALGKEIKQGLIDLNGMAGQAPVGEARNAFNAYIAAAEREFVSPTKNEPGPNLIIGDMADVEKGDMTQ